MRKVTISIQEDLLRRSHEYAAQQGCDLNELIINLLTRTVIPPELDPVQRIISNSEDIRIQTKDWKFNRDEIYDRE